jgi:secondary thiamine-phosphate synthase enzyme
MKTTHKTIEYQTKGEFDFIDITEEVKDFVKESQINNGFINVQTLHTTAALILNENEPLLLEDIKRNLERLSPGNIKYRHDDFTTRTVNMCPDECANGRSHCKAIFLPVKNPRLFILDEEDDDFYKNIHTPKYHARDVAVERAKITKGIVVLGTATPSIETYHKTKYHRWFCLRQL